MEFNPLWNLILYSYSLIQFQFNTSFFSYSTHPLILIYNDLSYITWDFQQCGMCDQQSLRSACACTQSDLSLCLSLEYSMNMKLLREHNQEFLSLKGGCTDSSESSHLSKCDRGKIGPIALHWNFMNLGLFMLNTVSSSWVKILYVCPRQMYYNC